VENSSPKGTTNKYANFIKISSIPDKSSTAFLEKKWLKKGALIWLCDKI
jgi:hypothetical protein